jgi:hypothetical protein
VVKSHLIKRGFKKSYTIWTAHFEIDNALLEVDRGEVRDDNSYYQDGGVFDGADHGIDDDDFDYEELLRHIEPQVLNSMGTDRGLDNIKILEKSSKEPLYDESNGCGKEFTQLRVVLELLKLKASHGWSDNSFSELLSLLGKLLPKPNTLPTSTYRAKKRICLLSLGVEKIHACPNRCILYRKEHEFKMKCACLRPNGKYFLPPASYTLTAEEKNTLCQCLRGVRVPTGFSSNISKLVSMSDLSMYSYNSNDCHVMMMVFLAIAIWAIKLVHVKVIITRLCYFFNTVLQKVIGCKELDDLRAYMIDTMCMREMCFSPF